MILLAAIVLVLGATLGGITTYTPEARQRGHTVSMPMGLAAVGLVTACWKWTPLGARLMSVGIVIAAIAATSMSVDWL